MVYASLVPTYCLFNSLSTTPKCTFLPPTTAATAGAHHHPPLVCPLYSPPHSSKLKPLINQHRAPSKPSLETLGLHLCLNFFFWLQLQQPLLLLLPLLPPQISILKYAMQQAFKTMMGQMDSQNNQFNNAGFSPGSPFPFPFPPPPNSGPTTSPPFPNFATSGPAASPSPATSQSVVTVDVPMTKVEVPPPTDVKYDQDEEGPKKYDVSPEETIQKSPFGGFDETTKSDSSKDVEPADQVSQNGTAYTPGVGASEVSSSARVPNFSILVLKRASKYLASYGFAEDKYPCHPLMWHSFGKQESRLPKIGTLVYFEYGKLLGLGIPVVTAQNVLMFPLASWVNAYRTYKGEGKKGMLQNPQYRQQLEDMFDKRFAGFSKDSKQLDAEVHRKYIYGGHVSAYMATLMEDEPEKYQSHFWWCGGCAQLTKSTTSPYTVLSRSTDESCMRTRALTGKSGQPSQVGSTYRPHEQWVRNDLGRPTPR
ncbi:hypothetical protein TEA_029988 [Camellia sinensis var. sinensis]|uniref:Uncharacterized protein n=1 Tax=Camellia sinensis var. sinensis TaxID=542762 RepID=A0A4S4ERK1_CAMSN|nr:hypothetical protein TEA_029988 [Camellia sinensis var. sinensis]